MAASYILIAGTRFTGTIEGTYTNPPILQSKLTKYWGVAGVSELRGQRGHRQVDVPFILHMGSSSYAGLRGVLEELDRLVGWHGTIEVNNPNNNVARSFPFSTFDGFTPGKSHDSGPLPDVANGLGMGINRWFIHGTFSFRQLLDGGGSTTQRPRGGGGTTTQVPVQ